MFWTYMQILSFFQNFQWDDLQEKFIFKFPKNMCGLRCSEVKYCFVVMQSNSWSMFVT